jgi:hypothetical protein
MTTLWEDLRTPPTRTQRWKAVLRKQPSAFLLAIQLLVILMLPWLETVSYGRVVLTMLSGIALVVAVVTVRSTPALTWLSALLMVPAMGFEIWAAVGHESSAVNIFAHFALAAFYGYTAYGLISYMFEDSWVTKDELFAVAAAFTVLLFAFGYLYLAVQEIYPGSFAGGSGKSAHTFLELLYFSGANLTGCGLSDITSVGSQARAVTIIEQLAGVLYVAMVISRLVALTAMRNRS